MPIPVDIRAVSKHFPGAGRAGPVVALDRVSIAIEPGELFFLLGPSGCGKTTLLRAIAGFLEPTGGTIAFGGRDVTRLPAEKRNTGMVFQSYALWPHMTVEANVAFGLDVRGVRGHERARRVAEALALVRMQEYAGRSPNQLSGGQQQRVALARAVVVRPDVLLLDEPLSNLDARLRIELRAEIRRICKESGITTVYVTHDQKEALSMADRIAILNRGALVQVGAAPELYRRPGSRFAAEFLGETNFIPASVAGSDGARTTVSTPIGSLVSASPPPPAREGVCSIRPESFRMDGPAGRANTIDGRIVASTYLGELAHHDVEVAGAGRAPVRLRVAQLNPTGVAEASGRPVSLSVDPADVVLLA